MSRLLCATLSSVFILASGCSGRAVAVDVGRDAGSDDPSDAAGGGGGVVWGEEFPNPYVWPGPDDEDGVLDPNAYDFGMRYIVTLPSPNVPAATVQISICQQRANAAARTCEPGANSPAVEGDGRYRWGFDPSNYDTGFNVYEHVVTLQQGAEVLDEATLRFEITAP